jgi:hypothetical protein
MLILPMPFALFSTTEAGEHDSPCGSFYSLTRKTQVGGRQRGKASLIVLQVLGFGVGKGTNGVGRVSGPGVLRLRAPNAVHPINA